MFGVHWELTLLLPVRTRVCSELQTLCLGFLDKLCNISVYVTGLRAKGLACIYVHMYAHVTCVCMYMCIWICACLYMCEFMCYMCMHVCVYECVHVCMYLCVTCECVCMCTHVCMHACIQWTILAEALLETFATEGSDTAAARRWCTVLKTGKEKIKWEGRGRGGSQENANKGRKCKGLAKSQTLSAEYSPRPF